jgi:chromosome segregation protein
LVVASAEEVKAAIDFLRERKLGRASFLPLDKMLPTVLLPRKLLRLEGVVGRACDLVSFDRRFRPVFEYLLGRVLIVRDRGSALALVRQTGAGTRVVTLDGEIFDASGPVRGGDAGTAAPATLGREGEIKRVESELREAERRLASLGEERAKLEEGRKLAGERMETHTAEARRLEKLLARSSSELEALERDAKRLESERLSAAAEFDHAVRDRDSVGGEIEELSRRAEALEDAEQAATEAAERLAGQMESAAAERTSRQREHADRRSAFAGLREKAKAAARELEQLERELAERGETLRTRRDELDRADSRARELREAAKSMAAELVGKTESLEKLAAEAERARARREELRSARDSVRRAAREAKAELLEAQTALGEKRVKENELVVKIEALEQRALDDFGVSLAERLDAPAQPEASEEPEEEAEKEAGKGDDAGGVEDMTGGEPEAQAEESPDETPVPDEVDVEALREEIKDLRRKLDAMGAVNHFALQEQEELKERSQFLKTQFEDLAKARRSLKDVIGRINAKSRELFKETFESVRGHFQGLFRKLFGGGKADVYLEEGEDVLEAGIEIIARPPGKEPRSLTLLSGGEKAMTTIALLFAIFRAKPSPFCVLDEVDAPLDDANVERFNQIIKEYTTSTQFIMVTHNKATMVHAEVLYGVTMQELGVSRKVSINLQDVEAGLNLAPAAKAA